MKITIRELNSFGNVLQSIGRISFAKHIHQEVQEMLNSGITELDIDTETENGKATYDAIKKAEWGLKQLKKENKQKVRRF